MKNLSRSVSLIALALALPAPAFAQGAAATAPQPAPAPAAQPDTGSPAKGEIVVTADRVRGQVETTSAPVVELNQQQIAAYGARSIADLVAQLAPQIGAGRGRGGIPLFLVNGQRITNFREIRRYPPEALLKVEVLPEEVALKYGAQPDQRVINFILKNNFSSRELELEYGQPTAGGYRSAEAVASLLAINGPQRTNASIQWNNTTPLTEADRGVVQTPGSTPTVATDRNPAAYRTLVAQDAQLEANVTATRTLGGAGSTSQLTLNGQWLHDISRSLSGLDTVLLTNPAGQTALRTLDADPLTRRTRSDTLSLGTGLTTQIGNFEFQATVDAARGVTHTDIDQRRNATALVAAAAAGTLAIDGTLPVVARAGTDVAESKTYTIDSLATLKGEPLRLPGGGVSLTLSTGYKLNGIDSSDTRSAAPPFALDRRRLSGDVSVSVPITSRREGFGAAIGDVSVNFGGGLDRLSDFGTLSNWNGGVTWKPIAPLTLSATYVNRDEAPSLTQLGAPSIVTFNVPYFDFATGQTVLVTQTSGGNPALVAEKQRDWKLSASLDLPFFDRANVLVEYYSNHSSNVSASFPQLTAATEAAFPGRVTRNGNGVLTAIDLRPVTYAETRSQRLRYGFNLFGRVGKPNPNGQGGFLGRMAGAGGGSGAPAAPAAPATSGAPTGPAAPAPRAGGAGGFDPARFQAMRDQFCAAPEGTMPDLSQLPAFIADRLKGPDGQIDPAKVAAGRARLCGTGGGPAVPIAPGGIAPMDPQRFLAMRSGLHCDDPAKEPDLATIPAEVIDQLKGPDGTLAPARLKEFRERVCALPLPQLMGLGGPPGEAGGAPSPQGGPGEQGTAPGAPPPGDAPPAAPSAAAAPPPAGGPPPGGARGGVVGDGQGRWSLSLYHTVNLASTVLIAPGGPALDLLNGDTTGSGGGLSRHSLELEGGMFLGGFGFRLSGKYNSATTVRGSGLPGSSTLRFGDLATFNLRTFVALDQQKWLVGSEPGFFKNARLSLRVDNLFDARQRVTDQNGVVPLAYQPALIDPVGRYVEIELRKLF